MSVEDKDGYNPGDLLISRNRFFLWGEDENNGNILPIIFKEKTVMIILSKENIQGDVIGRYIKVMTDDCKVGWVDICQIEKL